MEQYLNQLAAVWGKYILPILEFVIGLGVIVFVHELGHFIVAKWVGIKVEQFAFGFGKRLCGFVIGETDYRINLVPLGGYVKMLGQEDFKPLKEGDKPDPRAFDQKSVGARFAVISAGVIMNVILAAVLFTIVARVGMDSPAPVIASVLPGTPAYKATVQFEGAPAPATVPASLVPQTPPMILAAPAAIRPAYDPWNNRLQPGDKIVRISGSNIILWLNSGRIPTMQEVMLASALSSKDDLYDFTIERTVGKVTRTGKADQVGVTFDGEKMIFGLGSPALIPVIGKSDNAVDIRPFQVDDRIIKIGDESIDNEWDISRVEDTLNGGPVTVTVDCGPKTEELNIQPGLRKADDYVFSPDGASFHCRITEVNRDEDKAVTSYTVQTDDGKERKLTEDQMDLSLGNLVNFLGMSPRLKVVTVLEGSPADKKGLKPGDIIQAYGDKRNPAYKELVDVSKDKSRKNAETEIEVLRGQESKTIAITPKNRNDTAVLGILVGGDWEHLVRGGAGRRFPRRQGGHRERGDHHRGERPTGQDVDRPVQRPARRDWPGTHDHLSAPPGRRGRHTQDRCRGQGQPGHRDVRSLGLPVLRPRPRNASQAAEREHPDRQPAGGHRAGREGNPHVYPRHLRQPPQHDHAHRLGQVRHGPAGPGRRRRQTGAGQLHKVRLVLRDDLGRHRRVQLPAAAGHGRRIRRLPARSRRSEANRFRSA